MKAVGSGRRVGRSGRGMWFVNRGVGVSGAGCGRVGGRGPRDPRPVHYWGFNRGHQCCMSNFKIAIIIKYKCWYNISQ